METTYKVLKLIIWVLLFATVITGAYILYNRLSAQVQLPGIGEDAAAQSSSVYQAPDFTVYDLEGNPHTLCDFTGKPVVLNFWASWCGPCKSEMPTFQKFYEEYGDQVHFLMVNLTDGGQETVQTASAYIASCGYTFPVYYDTQREAAYQYGVNAVPVTYFIDAQGKMLGGASGALSAERLQQGIDHLLG